MRVSVWAQSTIFFCFVPWARSRTEPVFAFCSPSSAACLHFRYASDPIERFAASDRHGCGWAMIYTHTYAHACEIGCVCELFPCSGVPLAKAAKRLPTATAARVYLCFACWKGRWRLLYVLCGLADTSFPVSDVQFTQECSWKYFFFWTN